MFYSGILTKSSKKSCPGVTQLIPPPTSTNVKLWSEHFFSSSLPRSCSALSLICNGNPPWQLVLITRFQTSTRNASMSSPALPASLSRSQAHEPEFPSGTEAFSADRQTGWFSYTLSHRQNLPVCRAGVWCGYW